MYLLYTRPKPYPLFLNAAYYIIEDQIHIHSYSLEFAWLKGDKNHIETILNGHLYVDISDVYH